MAGVSEDYIRRLAEDRRQAWAEFRKAVEADVSARNNKDFTLGDVPENYRASTDVPKIARIPDTAQRLVAICTDDEPAIKVRPTAETQKATRNASLREKCLAASIEVMNDEAGRDVWRMAMDSALTKRLGIIKMTLNVHAWDGEPQRQEYTDSNEYLAALADYRKGAAFPIRWEDVDPVTYFPDRVGSKPREVLEIANRPLLPTMEALGVRASIVGSKCRYKKLRLGEKFPADGGLGSTSTQGEVECIEYWNDHVVAYLIDGQKVDEIEHGYGRPPYFAFGSYTSPSRKPEEAYNSVVGLMRDQIKSLKRYLAIKSNWAYLAGWPFFEEDANVQGGANPADVESISQIQAGSILRGIKFMAPPATGTDLNQMIQIWQAESDRSGLAAVMFGQGAGTSSGYQVASLQAAAQSVLKPVIRNAGAALADVLAFEQMLIDKHVFRSEEGGRVGGEHSKVYVWGSEGGGSQKYLGFGPDDINGYYPVKVELRPLLPLDEIAQRDSAIRMRQAGLWDPETALEKTGENQPEEILDKVWAYEYLERSGLNARIGQDAAEKAGLIPTPEVTGPPGPPVAMGPGPAGIGGPGMGPVGPIEPSVPGQTMPLRPPMPVPPNMPAGVPRQPGGPRLVGPVNGTGGS